MEVELCVCCSRPAVVVIARSTQEGIVVNLPSLWGDQQP